MTACLVLSALVLSAQPSQVTALPLVPSASSVAALNTPGGPAPSGAPGAPGPGSGRPATPATPGRPSAPAALALTQPAAQLALTPPMGWNGYNRFSRNVTAAVAEAAARAIVSSGMKAAGYDYVNLDGGWALRQRSATGVLQADPAKFPEGIGALADYVHSLGLRFGIYTSVGTQNCAASSAGSFGHFQQDAATFASWHVDYVKLDWCYVPYSRFPALTHQQVSQQLAGEMAAGLAATGRPIVFDVNDTSLGGGGGSTGTWARSMAKLWRTAPDIRDTYSSMVWNFTHSVSEYRVGGPGGWNDPDMLEVGNGGMTATEYRSQFSLWSEMAAPLIAGNDVTTMTATTRGILENAGVIAVDQDPLGRPGVPILSTGGHWVLVKPLANGDMAVTLFNQTDTAATISASGAQLGLRSGARYDLHDLWSGTTTATVGPISATLAPHAVAMYRVVETALPSL